VQARFRLSSSNEIKRVRREGKSYAHPLFVLVVMPNQVDRIRVAVIAGRSVGKAVQRNRAKRLLREAIRPLISEMKTGWDLVLIARHRLLDASFPEVQTVMAQLLKRSRLIVVQGE
jgi:ribonuclease P protein component